VNLIDLCKFHLLQRNVTKNIYKRKKFLFVLYKNKMSFDVHIATHIQTNQRVSFRRVRSNFKTLVSVGRCSSNALRRQSTLQKEIAGLGCFHMLPYKL
jgi:hypothetical protein